MLKLVALFVFATIIQSCSFMIDDHHRSIIKNDKPVEKKDSFYLIYPKNGYEYNFPYIKLEENKQSAAEFVDTFNMSMAQKLGTLEISNKNISLEEGLKNAKLAGIKYLVDANISYWKDASYITCATNSNVYYLDSSSKQNKEIQQKTYDKLDVVLKVYDVETSALINEQRLFSAGCPTVVAYIPIGKSSPSDRLKESLYVWLGGFKAKQ